MLVGGSAQFRSKRANTALRPIGCSGMEADGKVGTWNRLGPWAAAAVLALACALGAWATAGDAPAQRLRVGGDAHYPPYHFLDPRGRADGFDVELARAVAAELGMEPVFEFGDWSLVLQRLERGELDVTPMFWSAARKRRFLLSEPILLRHHALFGHYEAPTVPSLDALANARVAVQRSGLAAEAMRELALPGVTLVEPDNEAETLDLVVQGKADYALAPTGIGYRAIQSSGLPGIVALSPPLLERKYVFAITRERPDLVPRINHALQRLRRNGLQNRLYVKWIGSPGMQPGAATDETDGDRRLLVAGLAALAILLAAAVALLALRRRPASRTAPRSAPPRPRPTDPALLAELRQAIADGDALGFALQPKQDLHTGRWLGAELLVRWNHPRLGPLEPDDFVPFAEQAGMIGELTLHLVRRGMAQCRDWPVTGDSLHVSINVSANDLADPRLVDAIIEAGRGGGPGLMLEITETEVMREPERVAEALPRLRAHGIRISVDDFGAGHSSLVNLRRLAPDELKIDRSFVVGLSSSHSDRAIVRATIHLGHELGARVAAEGIEDEATRSWLRDAGCDAGQGFGIARPMPPERFCELLRGGA